MGIITPEVVENYWNNFSETQQEITAVLSRSSVLPSDVTVISHFTVFTPLFVCKEIFCKYGGVWPFEKMPQ